jgi:DNA-binding transcriptional ArsR family regulator
MLDGILDTRAKVRILRHFTSRTEDYMASGREVARRVGLSAPAAHAALKDLLDERIVERQIIGRQHIYRLNHAHRTVKEILAPAFRKAAALTDDVARYLVEALRERGILAAVESLMLYGSVVRGPVREGSDCDVAAIVRDGRSKARVERCLRDEIGPGFLAYFGMHLDPYVRTFGEFGKRMAKRLPPVSTMMDSYLVVHGRDPGGCGTG